MDRELPFYTRTESAMTSEEFIAQHQEEWKKLIEEQQMPALDHQMAITRFANSEVGRLIASSDQTQIIQQVVGNSFTYRVEPFRQQDQKIVVAGHGLGLIESHSKSNDLLSYLQQHEQIAALLSETGWLPVTTDLLVDYTFLQQLPLPQIMRPLAANHRYFVSDSFTAYSRQKWTERYELILEWEQQYSQQD